MRTTFRIVAATSLILMAMGAILRFESSITGGGSRVHTAGVITLAAGAGGLMIAIACLRGSQLPLPPRKSPGRVRHNDSTDASYAQDPHYADDSRYAQNPRYSQDPRYTSDD
jgi:hypothetical protein